MAEIVAETTKGGIYGSCNRHRDSINDYVFCCSVGTHQEGEDVTSRPTHPRCENYRSKSTIVVICRQLILGLNRKRSAGVI